MGGGSRDVRGKGQDGRWMRLGWCMDENEEEWCMQKEKERRKERGGEDGKEKEF